MMLDLLDERLRMHLVHQPHHARIPAHIHSAHRLRVLVVAILRAGKESSETETGNDLKRTSKHSEFRWYAEGESFRARIEELHTDKNALPYWQGVS